MTGGQAIMEAIPSRSLLGARERMSTRPRVFLTYAWKDNQEKTVDLIIQTLEKQGVEVLYDRSALLGGRRLWEQIGQLITGPDVHGWVYVVSPSSLSSEGCKEELYLALGRALDTRGADFPLVALMHEGKFSDLPPSLRIRLGASLEDPAWPEVVLSALQGRPPNRQAQEVLPLTWRLHRTDHYVLEMRPRLGQVSPYSIGVPHADLPKFDKWLEAPPNSPSMGLPMLMGGGIQKTETHHYVRGIGPLSSVRAVYLHFSGFELPANVQFRSESINVQIDPSKAPSG
jgi:hypothetical protein